MAGEGFDLLVSQALLTEYEEVLRYPRLQQRHHMSDAEITDVIAQLAENAVVVFPRMVLDVVADDPDDNVVLECATEGGADIIVSGDKHLLNLREFNGIQILSPAEFLILTETL